MIKAFVKKISTLSGYEGEGVTFLEEAEAETISSNYVRVKPGQSTSEGMHDDEEEVYIVLGGKAKLRLGEETHEVEKGDVVYIPRNVVHQATCVSDVDFEYICVCNWPDRIPGQVYESHH
ncbi:cupin domain-containing protein [Paenibacillus koleovorans]|uniref:cupin domain-containing protein n=1 Tax=Paenibacillus koleovorans TaxID=121608 RepID=UPI000FD7452A|nr:cupin domain-containing protein [Paenibacillus koleovorans]